jgi:antitoxin (DNA-binding transcriptional repressor) of toxin-antitoxin stability system
MERAGVAQLKARLSEYLARVERGEAIARIIPVDHSALSNEDDLERLRDLERIGVLKLGGRVPDSYWSMPLPDDADGRMLDALLEERESGR